MTLRTFLQAKLHPLEVTSTSVTEPDALVLCEQLCWAAELVELEQVEVSNLSNGKRFATYLQIGKLGQVQVNGSAAHDTWPGDALTVAAFVLLPPEAVAHHAANFVEVGKGNGPIMIRRRLVRAVTGHPSYVPIQSAKQSISKFSASNFQLLPEIKGG